MKENTKGGGIAPKPRHPSLEVGDYYLDGLRMVFTERYHIRRGYCCKSGCRHCPYGNAPGKK